MGHILKFRSPNLYTVMIVAKLKKGFLKKKERVKGFFIFMTMLSFKQVESNYGKKEPCERGCSWIIKFSHYLNFEYRRYGLIIFSVWTQNGCTRCIQDEKNLWSEQILKIAHMPLLSRIGPDSGKFLWGWCKIELSNRLLSKHFCLQSFSHKDWVFLQFAKSKGKCISDILFDFKAYIVHCW